MDELEALIILTSIPSLGSIKVRLLVQHFGSAAQALQSPLSAIADLPGFGPKILQAWQQTLKEGTWKLSLELAEKLHAHLVPYTSPHYPRRLLELIDHPPLLYLKGELNRSDDRSLAIIGTRQATIYGLEMAKQMSRELAQAGFTIVSGLARGIDTAAHQGALEGKGRTLAVLGSGLAHLYPKENERLAEAIAEQGALISEFPMQTPPDRTHFPQRNRLVSGMTLGTLLIEAPLQSGAMLTVERALSQGRQVWALPGRADQDNFRSNHLLIKEHKAALVENSSDIVQCFDTLFAAAPSNAKNPPTVVLEQEEAFLLKQLPVEEVSIEEIVRRTQLPINQINGVLMSLVLKKIIKEFPGKIYKKIQ